MYQIDIIPHWDDKSLRTIRVQFAIDDGGLRAFFPMTDSFILSPEGRFVGEP